MENIARAIRARNRAREDAPVSVPPSRSDSALAQATSLEEHAALLETGKTINIAAKSWVRILRRGSYKRDLALVCDVDKKCLTATVLLIPRIHLTLKRSRKGHAKQSLFDIASIKEAYPNTPVKNENGVVFFRGEEFFLGMLRRKFDVSDLSNDSVNASEQELDFFRRTKQKWIVEAADSGVIKLQISNKIKVIDGPLRGILGYITDVQDDHVVTIESDQFSGPQQLRTWEVRKRFTLGDFVQTLCGEDRGSRGFIVEMDEEKERVVIYRIFGSPKLTDSTNSNIYPDQVRSESFALLMIYFCADHG
jgi:transcription elongation factor